MDDTFNAEHEVKLVKHLFYYKNNFILTNGNEVYYYKNEKFIYFPCGTCAAEFDFTTPPFINLLPEKLIKVNPDTLCQFIKDLNNIERRHIGISIASCSDTISNKYLKNFLDAWKETEEKRITYSFRLLTEEESNVLQAKRNNQYYNPDSIIWKNKFGRYKIIAPSNIKQ